METLAATNAPPKRRPRLSRRASMSALPSYSDKKEKFGFNKKELQKAYKTEKKERKKAHDEAEKKFRQTIEDLTYEPVSGLAEQEETMVSKINLETFSRPKASKRERRASLGMTLRILTPPSSPKLDLEEIEAVSALPSSPVKLLPPPPMTTATTNRRGMLQRSMSCQLDAEALAGWKTVTFPDGPMGLQLEPTIGDKAARVTGFIDTAGKPSVARATGEIEFNDIIVKVNAKVPKSFDQVLQILSQGGERVITFRPSFGYEIDGLDTGSSGLRGSKKHHKKKKKKSKKNSLMMVDDDSDDDNDDSDNDSAPQEQQQQQQQATATKTSQDNDNGEMKPAKGGGKIQIQAFCPQDKKEKKKKDKKKKSKSKKKDKTKTTKEEAADSSDTDSSTASANSAES